MNIGLTNFLRGDTARRVPGCAYFYRNSCVFGQCGIQVGKRCSYFERAVLPSAKDIGQYDRLVRLYENQTGATCLVAAETNRFCSCGQRLNKRRRICDKCRILRHRQAMRLQMRKRRG